MYVLTHVCYIVESNYVAEYGDVISEIEVYGYKNVLHDFAGGFLVVPQLEVVVLPKIHRQNHEARSTHESCSTLELSFSQQPY